MIDTFEVRQCAVPDAGYEYIPLLVDVTGEINEHRRERYHEMVQISMCEEKETVNDQERGKVSNNGRSPGYSVA